MPPSLKPGARSVGREHKPRSASRERAAAGGGGGAGAPAGSGVAMWIGDPVDEDASTAEGEPDSPLFAPRTAKERMLEIKELLEMGLLTRPEFEEKRSQILAEL